MIPPFSFHINLSSQKSSYHTGKIADITNIGKVFSIDSLFHGELFFIPYKNTNYTCQDVRNQKKIQELDCPRCHEPGGIEAFVKDGILAEDGVCDNCGYILPEGTELEEVE